jgi:hypothetical protein
MCWSSHSPGQTERTRCGEAIPADHEVSGSPDRPSRLFWGKGADMPRAEGPRVSGQRNRKPKLPSPREPAGPVPPLPDRFLLPEALPLLSMSRIPALGPPDPNELQNKKTANGAGLTYGAPEMLQSRAGKILQLPLAPKKDAATVCATKTLQPNSCNSRGRVCNGKTMGKQWENNGKTAF